MKYGFITLPKDIGKALMIGLLIAGVISGLIPDDYFSSLMGGGILAMFIMMLIGIPVYVCATASVPVAAAFIAAGVSPGAALVFLMTGPATNAATIAVIWKTMGEKTAVTYVASVAIMALVSGVLLDYIYTHTGTEAGAMMHEMFPGWFEPSCAIVLLLVLGYAFMYKPPKREIPEIVNDKKTETIIVKGMTCTHCQGSVEKAILSSAGVEDAIVDLSSGKTTIIGKNFDMDAIKKKIVGLTFEVEDK